MKVVIVEDQKDLSSLIRDKLAENNIKSDCAYTGEDALNIISSDYHDLIILDRGLPDMEGLELLKTLREEGTKIPVLILTAKDGIGDKVEGLNTGADDYLVKPFEVEELIARIHALYRRPSDAIDVSITLGNIQFIPSDNILKVRDEKLDISVKERDALERLIRLPEKVVSKDDLQSAIYGHEEEGSHNAVEVIVHRLRKKLEDSKADVEIKTLRGIGYLIKERNE